MCLIVPNLNWFFYQYKSYSIIKLLYGKKISVNNCREVQTNNIDLITSIAYFNLLLIIININSEILLYIVFWICGSFKFCVSNCYLICVLQCTNLQSTRRLDLISSAMPSSHLDIRMPSKSLNMIQPFQSGQNKVGFSVNCSVN